MELITEATSPEILSPAVISTGHYERDFALSPDGKECMFTLVSPKNKFSALVQINKSNGQWGNPKIASFSGSFSDLEPFYAPDGRRLYFASKRPTENAPDKKDFDIWYVTKDSSQNWSGPVNVDEPVNSSGHEYYPAVTEDGNLYFTAQYPDTKGAEDIYMSRWSNGVFSTPVSLDSTVNSKHYEFNAYVSPDEKLIVFTSYGRQDDLGGGDLYFSRKNEHGQWSEAKHMGAEINSAFLDFCPFYNANTNMLYFSSERHEKITTPASMSYSDYLGYLSGAQNGNCDIYHVFTALD